MAKSLTEASLASVATRLSALSWPLRSQPWAGLCGLSLSHISNQVVHAVSEVQDPAGVEGMKVLACSRDRHQFWSSAAVAQLDSCLVLYCYSISMALFVVDGTACLGLRHTFHNRGRGHRGRGLWVLSRFAVPVQLWLATTVCWYQCCFLVLENLPWCPNTL
jgi:hypothetical protein